MITCLCLSRELLLSIDVLYVLLYVSHLDVSVWSFSFHLELEDRIKLVIMLSFPSGVSQIVVCWIGTYARRVHREKISACPSRTSEVNLFRIWYVADTFHEFVFQVLFQNRKKAHFCRYWFERSREVSYHLLVHVTNSDLIPSVVHQIDLCITVSSLCPIFVSKPYFVTRYVTPKIWQSRYLLSMETIAPVHYPSLPPSQYESLRQLLTSMWRYPHLWSQHTSKMIKKSELHYITLSVDV